MDGKGVRGKVICLGSRRSVGLFFLLASFLPAVLCLLVGHQGSLLRDGIKKDGGGGFGLVWLGDININIISYCAVVSYIGFTWLWFFFFILFSSFWSSFFPIFIYICLSTKTILSKFRARQPCPARDRKDGNSGSGWA